MLFDTISFESGWVVLTPPEASVKKKIERKGKPLKQWDVKINYGIKTGYNEAFIIDKTTRDNLIKKSPKTVEIIRPILRGKDIKRYRVDFANLWVLFIPWHFPLHEDSSIIGSSEKAEDAFRDQYPAVYNHLLKYKDELSKRNSSETGIRYEWYALQRYGSSYWKEFSMPKITWGNLALNSQFAFTEMDCIVNAPSPFFATDSKYLLGILNSKISSFYIKSLCVARSGGYLEFKPMFVENFPIPEIPQTDQEIISDIVEQVLSDKKKGLNTTAKEAEIDKLVYKIYGLTEDEKLVIESLVTND